MNFKDLFLLHVYAAEEDYNSKWSGEEIDEGVGIARSSDGVTFSEESAPTQNIQTGMKFNAILARVAGWLTKLSSHLSDTTSHITSAERTSWNNKTSNTGTLTGITMNGVNKGTSGVVDLGTVITEHQNVNNATSSFTAASSRANIATGDTYSTILGKISKWFTDISSHLGDTTVHITSTERTNWNNKTSNTGTVTSVSMNGASKGTTAVDLGRVLVGLSSGGSKAGAIVLFSSTDGVTTKLATTVGSATQGMYIDANGVPQAMTYSLNKTVPSDAVFTDTTYTPYSSNPAMDGTASAGSSSYYSRGDHVHPTDTSREATSNRVSSISLESTSKSSANYPTVGAVVSLLTTDTPNNNSSVSVSHGVAGCKGVAVHTTNLNSQGAMIGYYADNEAWTKVVTITGATKLKVTVLVQSESTSYDFGCVWAGSHSSYTCASNSGSAVAMTKYGTTTTEQKLGGNALQKYVTEISGDTVTIGWKSDTSNHSFYGMYVLVENAADGGGGSSYEHPTHTATTGYPTSNSSPSFGGSFYVGQVQSDSLGHVTGNIQRTITIPSTTASTSGNGLMTSTHYTKVEQKLTQQWYGTCSTATGTTAKVGTVSNFTARDLVAGTTVRIKFTYGNSATSPTLNVNSTGAKSIVRFGSTTGSLRYNSWRAGSVLTFVYDGSYWVLVNGGVGMTYNATVNSSTWSTNSNGGYKTSSITVSGLLVYDTPVIGIVQTGTMSTDKAMLAAWNLVSRIVMGTDSIILYAYGSKPTVNLPLQITVWR